MDLGATEWTTFRKITLPMIAPGVARRGAAGGGDLDRRLRDHELQRRPDADVPAVHLRRHPPGRAARGQRAGDRAAGDRAAADGAERRGAAAARAARRRAHGAGPAHARRCPPERGRHPSSGVNFRGAAADHTWACRIAPAGPLLRCCARWRSRRPSWWRWAATRWRCRAPLVHCLVVLVAAGVAAGAADGAQHRGRPRGRRAHDADGRRVLDDDVAAGGARAGHAGRAGRAQRADRAVRRPRRSRSAPRCSRSPPSPRCGGRAGCGRCWRSRACSRPA